jgi:hypothetical protein
MSDDIISVENDTTIIARRVVKSEPPDNIPGRALLVLEQAQAFVVQTPEDYEEGIHQIRKIKRERRNWKDLQGPSIAKAKDAYDEAKATLAKVDDKLGGAEDIYRERCEAWANTRRNAQRQMLTDTATAMAPTPAKVTEHLNEEFDKAVAAGDTAKAGRILSQAAMPASMHTTLPPPAALSVTDTFVPKVEGASLTTPYTYDILNEDLIAREFMMVDRKKIAALVRAMKKDAQAILGPGILVRPDTSLRVKE